MKKFQEKNWPYIQLGVLLLYLFLGRVLSTIYNNYFIFKPSPNSSMLGIMYPPEWLDFSMGIFAALFPVLLSILLVLLYMEKIEVKKVLYIISPIFTFPIFFLFAINVNHASKLDSYLTLSVFLFFIAAYFFLFKNFWQWIKLHMRMHLVWGLILINFVTIFNFKYLTIHTGRLTILTAALTTLCTLLVSAILILQFIYLKAAEYFRGTKK